MVVGGWAHPFEWNENVAENEGILTYLKLGNISGTAAFTNNTDSKSIDSGKIFAMYRRVKQRENR
jgi:hypothetical protein